MVSFREMAKCKNGLYLHNAGVLRGEKRRKRAGTHTNGDSCVRIGKAVSSLVHFVGICRVIYRQQWYTAVSM